MQRVFEICFATVVMVFGGVSLLTNQRLYRFLVKPRFELGVFPVIRSRPIGARSFRETADCLDDFETTPKSEVNTQNTSISQGLLADLGRSVEVTASLQLVWLNEFTVSKPFH